MTKAPRLYGPRDVPRLREYLHGQWAAGGLRYPQTEVGVIDGRMIDRTVMATGEWELPTLAAASLWWVATSMCEVLGAAEGQLPLDTVLDRTLMPEPSGLVVFEQPMLGVDAMTGERTMRVDAIVWGPCRVILAGGNRLALGIASYRKLRFEDGLSPNELSVLAGTGILDGIVEKMYEEHREDFTDHMEELVGDVWVPEGRSDWVIGEPVTHRHDGPVSDDAQASMIEDRQRMASLWLLTTQEGIATTTVDHGTRQEQRRAERVGDPQPTVRIVNIKAARRAAARERTEEAERHLTVRFLVSGFWRRQYYPSLRTHRPKWINPFWKGPADAPVKKVDKVRVWK